MEETPRTKLDKYRNTLKKEFQAARNDLSIEEQRTLADEIASDFELLKGHVAPPLPPCDLSGKTYPLYPKRTDPFKHLEDVWGAWLVCYTPALKQNYLCQRELKARDPVLFFALRNKLNRAGQGHLREYIPPYQGHLNL